MIVNAEAVFTRNAHSGTVSKPPGLGDYWYTDFPVDEIKCSQANDMVICVFTFVCICGCLSVFLEFHISNQLTDYHKLD